ncbi:DedA family protein [Acetobacter estunensis]|uniref:DedA family protein n=1 Tax=Acetobacter estunensis TaxID=104097 RepID=UPI001C2DBAB5|nr:VTT domain-containing protein [Acetobacter estunensis]MBV1837908.1 VTT domain-containing protein [Acetobacter estunensis]
MLVLMESMGIPVPAETCIITASLYCLKTHHLAIEGVALAAIAGAIIGDNFGYLIGRHFGLPLLEKYGARVGLTSERLILGQYLFRHHGSAIVFLGRFVSVVRVFVAILAGACDMRWERFMLFNAMGGTVWAGGWALGTYLLGRKISQVSGPTGIAIGVLTAVCLIGTGMFLKKNEKRLTQQALTEAKSLPQAAE